jgi:hypothetical protein
MAMNYSWHRFVIFATIRRSQILLERFHCEMNAAIHCGRA